MYYGFNNQCDIGCNRCITKEDKLILTWRIKDDFREVLEGLSQQKQHVRGLLDHAEITVIHVNFLAEEACCPISCEVTDY
jgi:hypothetical protein